MSEGGVDAAEVARIAVKLTEAQRRAVLWGQSEHRARPMALFDVIERLCWRKSNRPALFEEGLTGCLVTARLNRTGLAVRQHLTQHGADDHE